MGQNATYRQLLADSYAANLIGLFEVTCSVLNKRQRKEEYNATYFGKLAEAARDYYMKTLDWDNDNDSDLKEIAKVMNAEETHLFSHHCFTDSEIEDIKEGFLRDIEDDDLTFRIALLKKWKMKLGSSYVTYQALVLQSCEAKAASLADKICEVINSRVAGHSDNPEVPSQIGAALVTDHSNDSDGSSQVIVAIDRTADLNNPSQGHEEVKITKGVNGFGFKFGESSHGLIVKKLIDQSCCHGLLEGDILHKVNGENLVEYSSAKLATLLESLDEVTFLVSRASPHMLALEKSIKQGDTEAVQQILEARSIDISICQFKPSRTLSGNLSALMMASEEGQLEITRILIEKNADVDQMNGEGFSALMVASSNGHYDVANLLLEKASVDLQTNEGWSALMLASREGHHRVAELLLEKGANIDLQNKKKWSALMIACEKNHTEVVQLLIRKNAKVNMQKDDKGFALKIASQHGNNEVVKQLLDRDVEIDKQNNKGWSSLMSASKEGHADVAELLLDKGADVDLQNHKGFSALMAASEEGHVKVAKLLLKRGASVDLQSPKGDTSLSLAVINQQTEVIDATINHINEIENAETESQELNADTREEVALPSDAIALSLNTLYLIKWKDEEGTIQNFRLATKACKKWRDIRMLLNYTDEQLSDIESKNNGNDTQCWNYLMEKWLLSKGTPSYPASWEGLYQMLVDAEAPDIAKLLWNAVSHAVPPPPAPGTTTPQESVTVKPESVTVEPGENPAYDEIMQKQLFRENRPSRPPKRATDDHSLLDDFCRRVQFIVQVVNENEYQAAITHMKPPENTSFQRAVVFPRPGTVVGMFADKKTALIYTSEGSDCSDFVQDAIETFPNAQFVLGIGVGYAFNREQQKLGDVLVSKQICGLKKLRFDTNNELVDHGQRVDVVKDLTTTFCMDMTCEEDFKVSDKDRCSKFCAGQFASLPIIVESKEMRDKLHRTLPDAVGGDMESGELLKFHLKEKVKGIAVIKGVVHYADGNRADEWEFTASLAALHYANSKLYYYQDCTRSQFELLEPTPPPQGQHKCCCCCVS